MKKSEFTRLTHECSLAELQPKFNHYLTEYLNTNRLKLVDNEVRYCFETTNTKKGFFGKTLINYTNICISNDFLFWGIISDKKESGIAAAKWSDISEIWNWADTEKGKYFEDSGIELYGFIFQWSHKTKWFIGLGNDEAGKRCIQIMSSIIKK